MVRRSCSLPPLPFYPNPLATVHVVPVTQHKSTMYVVVNNFNLIFFILHLLIALINVDHQDATDKSILFDVNC